ncbi:putative protein bni4 [Erysiphe necator]|uniref:Dihydroflavonal-4-reductase protein n=1 Tax=Uncinula necator TaxID=52586 RepID=A0A0B1NYG9_UNCNE|nr:putative protein bni4 [Erysiphe necator]
MAALLQTYPQPSSTMSIIQSRPSSASGILSTKPHNQVSCHTSNNKIHIQRNSFNGINGGLPKSGYPGQSYVASIAPYAFTSTPELNSLGYSASTIKNSAANAKPSLKMSNTITIPHSSDFENRTLASNQNSNFTLVTRPHKNASIDETILLTPRSPRPGSATNSSSNSNQNLSVSIAQNTIKPSPGRYRRTYSQSIDLSNNSSSASSQSSPSETEPYSICSFKEFSLEMPQLTDFSLGISSVDRQESSSNQDPLRNRPIICSSNNSTTLPFGYTQNSLLPNQNNRYQNNYLYQNEPSISLSSSSRPYSSHRRDESSEGTRPAHAKNSKVNPAIIEEKHAAAKQNSYLESNKQNPNVEDSKSWPEIIGPNLPPRISSTDAVKRTFNPSPLSRPVDVNSGSPASKSSFASTVNSALQSLSEPTSSNVTASISSSSATAQLTALKKKDGKKRRNFRLRRAFSFGSAAEFRNVSSDTMNGYDLGSDSLERKNDMNQDGLDAEQIRIAQQQEAGGLGSGIYTGQGNLFSGSTDNLSISSTASSASIMIRKMGKGMKKSTRSIVGLFRPKSLAGSSLNSSAPEVGDVHVSIVNVEAERGSTLQPSATLSADKTGADTVKTGNIKNQMEFNSSDLSNGGNSCTEALSSLKSVTKGEKERAEVLTASKKGILKRSRLASEISLTLMKPQTSSSKVLQSPQVITGVETPNSTAPSTPSDVQQINLGHSSATYGNEDYFATTLRLQGSPKSQPATPSSSNGKRNTKFSPRIQFHDTWPSGEYDRRGEIATCNRLTPMLAQQIKEELNTFKMEMEVHENSKIYTHFF